MKVVLAISVVLALTAPVLAWVFIDGPTAALFLAATVFISVCASMPVVFSVVTRRNDLRRMEREEAEEIRMGVASPGRRADDGGGADQK